MNESSESKVRSEQASLCKGQGGASLEGKGGDPHKGHEAPCPESGHNSGGKSGSSY